MAVGGPQKGTVAEGMAEVADGEAFGAATTDDESLRLAWARMAQVEQDVRKLPRHLEGILKARLVTLRADLASTMMHQLKKAGKMPGETKEPPRASPAPPAS